MYTVSHVPNSSTGFRQSLPAELYVTDHPDDPREPLTRLQSFYNNLKKSGISSVRYDWRWAALEPQKKLTNQALVTHYQRVKEAMDTASLDAPTIILSSPPAWAMDLYKAGKTEAFVTAYKRYAELVAASLHEAGGKPITTVQVFNELNNRLYTRVNPSDIARLCSVTNDAFRPYFGSVQLLATVLALPRRPLISSVLPFLRRYRGILEPSFDIIGVDYYPGVWHWPLPQDVITSLKAWRGFRELVTGNTKLLESIYREIGTWQLEYELAEIGWTSHKLLGGEAAQEASFTVFSRAYRQMLTNLSDQGYVTPKRMGFYAARDEAVNGFLRYVTRWQRWGLYDDALQPKAIVELVKGEMR